MAFLNPLFLFGTLGISVPIVIHLLNRIRPRPVKWAAMELLQKSMRVRSRQIRLEDILLLIMRCIAICLLALAMSRPTITAQSAASFGIGRQTTGVVIAVDGSFSMERKPTANSRFDRALNYINEIPKVLKPGDVTSLVLMGNRPRIVLRNAIYDDLRFENAVNNLQTLQEGLNLELCLEQISSLIGEMKTSVRECYILTDAQKITWGNLSDKSMKTLQDIASQAKLFILTAEHDGDSNISLKDFKFVSGSLRQNSWVRYVAQIWNAGSQPQENIEVILLDDEKPLDKRMVSKIEPGEIKSVPLFANFNESGNIKLTAQLSWDPLVVDNSRYLVSHVNDNVRILCVDGVSSNQPYQSETDYIKTALVPKEDGISSSLSVETLYWTDSWSQQLSDYDIVMLANLPDITPDQTEGLYNFLQTGKGLIIFLGNQVNPQKFNNTMQLGQISLMPGNLLEIVQPQTEEGWSVEITSPDHPLANGLKGLPEDLLNQARLYQLFKVTPQPDTQEILKVVGEEIPFLIEKKMGAGKVLLFTSTADRDWTNLPIHPAYPILLHEAITYLTMKAYERPILVGEPMVAPLPSQTEQTDVTLRDSTGKEIFLQAGEREGRKIVRYELTDSSGFYELDPGVEDELLFWAVNIDPSESSVKILKEDELKKSLTGVQVQILTEYENLLAAIQRSRVGRELWPIFVILSLGILFSEGYLAHRFSKRSKA